MQRKGFTRKGWDIVKQKKEVLCLVLFALLLLFAASFPHLFGSKVDWLSQHTAFPDYFRTLFWKTGKLLPTFAFHLGGGQNLFFLSYYGLLAPWVLLSYGLSGISMQVYTAFLFSFLFVLDGILCFSFLKCHFKRNIAFFGSLLFLCSTSLLFHSHRHIMFVSYFPFLFLSLIGIDRYFKKGFLSFFTLQIVLLLFTNYYYAIPSLIALGCYTIFSFIRDEKKWQMRSFFKRAIPLLGAVFIALFTAAILLIPTFFALRAGRSSTVSVPIWQALLPNFNLATFFYDGYGLGLSFLSFFSLLFCLFQKEKDKRFLAIVLFLLVFTSFFLFLLNGGQYIRGKVLLPFLPLFMILSCSFLEQIKLARKYVPVYAIAFVIVLFLALLGPSTKMFFPIFLIDFFLLFLFLKMPKKTMLFCYLVFLLFVSVLVSRSDQFLSPAINKQEERRVERVLKKYAANPLYRSSVEQLSYVNRVFTLESSSPFLYSSLSNLDYKQFYTQFFHAIPNRNQLMLTSSVNLFYDTVMGVRYRYGKEIDSYGYQKIEKGFYKNQYAFPLIYGNTKLLSQEVYQTLKSQEKMEALLEYTVVDKEGKASFSSSLTTINFPFSIPEKIKEKLKIRKEGKHWILEPGEDLTFQLTRKKMRSDALLFLRFNLLNNTSCRKGDRTLTIDGQRNKIACFDYLYRNENKTLDYLLSTKNEKVTVQITKGKYILDDIECMLLPLSVFEEKASFKKIPEKFQVGKNYDTISFDLTLDKQGYFVSSIPYDEGFTLQVDGQRTPLEKVNEAFLGTPLSKGKHHLMLRYNPKGLTLGKILSLFGLFAFCLLAIKECVGHFRTKN